MLMTSDNAIDPEVWDWCPKGVSLIFTRFQFPERKMSIEESHLLMRSEGILRPATRVVAEVEPEVVVFGCTSGSFYSGLAVEPSIRAAMRAAGAKRAITTSQSVLQALRALGARRIAVGTPYDDSLAERLKVFLTEGGMDVVSLASHEPDRLDLASDEQVMNLAERAYRPGIDALFISCTALRTRHLIAPLSRKYGVPVISSVQATMWLALAAVGLRLSGPDHPLNALAPLELPN